MDKNKTALYKMHKKGSITPTINIYDLTSRLLKQEYYKNLEDIEKLLLSNAKKYDVEKDGTLLVKDSILDLITQVKYLLYDNEIAKAVKNKLRYILNKTQEHFLKEYFKRADKNMAQFLINLSLNKQDVFNNRLSEIKENYINDSVKRIKGESDELKKQFLQKMNDWFEGKDENLDVTDLVKEMKKTSVRHSKFFARDQLGKFNKSLNIATLKQASVKNVEWITVHDKAVRDTHKELDGKIFDINNIPQEYWDYNCRCTLLANEYY